MRTQASKVPGWFKVVGAVFGIGLLVVVATAVGGFLVLRSSLRQFEAADRSFDNVAERFGEIGSYRPKPEGMIPADRMEAFLEARERFAVRRERVDRALTLLSTGDSEKSAGALPKIGATVGLLSNLARFHHERNDALMDSEIGFGEYYYLYALTYYSWLGHSPADGPSFKIVGDRGHLLETIENLEEPAVRRYREEQARTSLNRLLLPVLRNQLADLAPRPDRSELRAFGEALASEIAALEADPRRLPWQDGLPEIVERSLLPFRDRLSDSYSAMCNAIEIGLARRSPDLANCETPTEPTRS